MSKALEREAFEKGIKSINFPLTRKGDGYRSTYTDNMWLAYQAGRADERKVKNEMRPIETAPKDGGWIVLARFGKNEAGTELGMWWICKACWSNRWSKWWDGIEPSGLNKPTHWIPLPKYPDAENDQPK